MITVTVNMIGLAERIILCCLLLCIGFLSPSYRLSERRFNATDFLEKLRGKSLMLVGDSMNRNQFESMLCVLREGLSDKSRMYEVHGHNITKGRGYFVFKFEVSTLFYP